MIKDNLKNLYNLINENEFSQDIEIGLKYIANTNFDRIECGKHEIIKDKIFANIQEYTTKESADFEAHKKHIDIQYVVSGIEKIGIGKINDFKEITEYNSENDIVFLTPKENIDLQNITLAKEDFAIIMPEDAHQPSMTNKEKSFVKKVVIKILV